LKTMICINY